MDLQPFTLTIDGEVDRPVVLRHEELLALPAVERTVQMNCAAGVRENTVMKGVTLAHLFDLAQVRGTARLAIFSCADGYQESVSLIELLQHEAFLVYSVEGEHTANTGCPLRLSIPGRYGCRWAKWVRRLELVADARTVC